MQAEATLGLAHLWAQADGLIRFTALILCTMSIASWYLILAKSWRLFASRRQSALIDAFWATSNLREGLALLMVRNPGTSFTELARQAGIATDHWQQHQQRDDLGSRLDLDELLTRALRKSIVQSTARLESGLTLLASIGSTAPFIGLFGTVWGIYNALGRISSSGMATLDKVAGPVGETLLMTALGLVVAIPAVLAYNAFTRANRLELAELDAFAHDLHASLSASAPPSVTQSRWTPPPATTEGGT